MIDKSCSRCGAAFGCGRDESSCWCSALPALPLNRLDPDIDCLCPDCLRALTESNKETGKVGGDGRDQNAVDPQS